MARRSHLILYLMIAIVVSVIGGLATTSAAQIYHVATEPVCVTVTPSPGLPNVGRTPPPTLP